MFTQSNPKTTLSRRLLMCTAMAALGVAGCAADGLGAEGDGEAEEDRLALQAPGTQQTIPDPKGVYFAEIKANGTGCPAGTWRTDISPDGLAFTTYFDAYLAQLDETMQYAIKDCTLGIKLVSPSGISYTITDFFYEGYAALDPGVQGRQTASYSFQGVPTLQTEKRTDLVGPYDSSYLFQDTVETTDLVWSPCGLERTLNVKTLLRLTNSKPRRSGIMNLAFAQGNTKTKLVFKINHRKCSTGTTAGSAGSTGANSGSSGSSGSAGNPPRGGR